MEAGNGEQGGRNRQTVNHWGRLIWKSGELDIRNARTAKDIAEVRALLTENWASWVPPDCDYLVTVAGDDEVG